MSLADLLIEYLGIVLSCLQIPMPEHFGNRLYRDTIAQRDRCGKCMPGNVKGQPLGDPAAVGYFFQIGVHLLVAQDRQDLVFLNTLGMVGIAL